MPTSGPSLPLAHSLATTLRSQMLTLFFLEVVGLRRTWDLRSYTGQALALLTGRRVAYGYRHIERFLAELAQAEADGPLTEALAIWTATLWKPRLRMADGPSHYEQAADLHCLQRVVVDREGMAAEFLAALTREGRTVVTVELKPFNDRTLNRDLQAVCTKVAQAQPHLPDGRRLLFRVQGTSLPGLDAQEQAVA